jgi:hypothetical protein
MRQAQPLDGQYLRRVSPWPDLQIACRRRRLDQSKEEYRDALGVRLVDDLWRDLRCSREPESTETSRRNGSPSHRNR